MDTRRARRRFLIGSGALLAAPLVRAQAQARIARIGWIDVGYDAKPMPRQDPLEGFRAGLRERGWIEGKNLVLEFRLGEVGRAAALTSDLLRIGTDVLFVGGPMFQTVREHAGATPIVFSMSGDPVEAKWVATLARPGGNVTGMTSMALDLEAKRLELLKEISPRIRRVAVLGNERHPGFKSQVQASEVAAKQLGITLLVVPLRTAEDFEAAFAAIVRERAEALHTFQDGLVHRHAKLIAEFAIRHRLPSVGGWMLFIESGGLLSYGPNERDYYRHVAGYIDRILRGANPGDLPVELPTRFELMLNRATAKSLGLTLPQSILLRAERLVE